MKIVFNGQEYPNLEAMPPAVRRAFEDAMTGLGDEQRGRLRGILSGLCAAAGPLERSGLVATSRSIVVNDEEYGDPSELPPALRQLYDEVRRRAGERGPGSSVTFVAGGITVRDDGETGAVADRRHDRTRGVASLRSSCNPPD